MNDAKHTKGPWEVQKLNHAEGELWLQIGCQRDGHSWGPIAELKYLVVDDEQQWADARLIAAAPDLLEACEAAPPCLGTPGHFPINPRDCHDWFTRYWNWQKQREAAICKAKAEGR